MNKSCAVLAEQGRKGGSQFKHKWNVEERDIVKRDYDGKNRTATLIAVKLSYMTGERITFSAVKGQVQRLGIAQDKSRRWTPEEEELLKELITQYAPRTIAHRLNRSINSVVVKSKRLHCLRRVRDGWFTKIEVCEILGVDHHKVQKWIDSGELKAKGHTDSKPQQNGGACWHILEADLKEFIIHHSFEFQGRNVDLFTIVQILSEE